MNMLKSIIATAISIVSGGSSVEIAALPVLVPFLVPVLRTVLARELSTCISLTVVPVQSC